jgi:hypothetical protein
VVRSETKSVALLLKAASTSESKIRELGNVLREAPGICPVTIVLDMGAGNEVVLVLPNELNVAADDQLLTALERHFGRQVLELR